MISRLKKATTKANLYFSKLKRGLFACVNYESMQKEH